MSISSLCSAGLASVSSASDSESDSFTVATTGEDEGERSRAGGSGDGGALSAAFSFEDFFLEVVVAAPVSLSEPLSLKPENTRGK